MSRGKKRIADGVQRRGVRTRGREKSGIEKEVLGYDELKAEASGLVFPTRYTLFAIKNTGAIFADDKGFFQSKLVQKLRPDFDATGSASISGDLN